MRAKTLRAIWPVRKLNCAPKISRQQLEPLDDSSFKHKNKFWSCLGHANVQTSTMAKDKQRSAKSVPNRHLHARITFLYQAATYLTLQATAGQSATASQDTSTASSGNGEETSPSRGILSPALQLGSHIRSVSKKGQIHLSSNIKRSICKQCNAILIPGRTSTHTIENKSKGGLKPWADVLEIECNFCGAKKRFPVGAVRQKKKKHRDVVMTDKSPNSGSSEVLPPDTPMVSGDSEHSTPAR